MIEDKMGGQAFPRAGTDGPEGYPGHRPVDGMTLRDYFAGQALTGIAATVSALIAEEEGTAADVEVAIVGAPILSYRLADAMLEARKG